MPGGFAFGGMPGFSVAGGRGGQGAAFNFG